MKNREPYIEKLGGKIELNVDQNIGPRYANFLSIMTCLENYFKQVIFYNFSIVIKIVSLLKLN